MKEQSKPALDLMEEAAHVLRNASPAALAGYFTGSIPFVLFLLYYWTDMSSAASAPDHILESSLALTICYLWMKTWHAVFTSLIRNQLRSDTRESISLKRWMRIAMIQSIIQPSALFLLPAALLILLPFGWVYAFYHNVTVFGDGESSDLNGVIRESWQAAGAWPFQNHKVLSIIFLLVSVIFLNISILLLTVPGLIQTFFGIETMFTRSGFHILNTTFLMAAIGISYLCLNPFMLVLFTLRCFYSEAQRSGEDLKIELTFAEQAYE